MPLTVATAFQGQLTAGNNVTNANGTEYTVAIDSNNHAILRAVGGGGSLTFAIALNPTTSQEGSTVTVTRTGGVVNFQTATSRIITVGGVAVTNVTLSGMADNLNIEIPSGLFLGQIFRLL